MSSALSFTKPRGLPKLTPIKSSLLGTLPPLDINFQGLLCQDGQNPAEFRKRKSKKKQVMFAPMEKEDSLQEKHQENTQDMNNGQFSFEKHKAKSELEDDVELEDLTVTTLLPPLPTLSQKKVGQQKSYDKKTTSFVLINKKKDQWFDIETTKPKNRLCSFLKTRPISSQESVKREETTEDNGLDFLESMNLLDIDLADVLQHEVHTDVGSASEPDLICQASSPQHDETDHEAGLDFLNASLDQSYEEWLNLQSNTGALVCDPPGGNVSHEESSELGLDHQTPSRHSPLPPSPTPLSWMGDEILTDISTESGYETDLEPDSEKPGPTTTSPVSSEAFNKFQDEVKFERKDEERLEADRKDRLLSLQEKRQAEERRMKEESAKETLKADQKRQEREIRRENNAIIEIKSSLLGPLPSLDTNFQGLLCQDGKNPAEFRKRKSRKKHVTLEKKESMEKKEQGFDVETTKPENRLCSFLKARPILSQESDVKREETSEDDGLDLFESMNLHLDIGDLADVLQHEVHTDDESASELELICQASSPQHDETDYEAGLDLLNASPNQSYEEWLNLQSNTGTLVCDPPGDNVSHEESSELGLDHQTPSRSSSLPPSPTPSSWMEDKILTDISAEYESDIEYDSNKLAPTAASPVDSEAFNKFQDVVEKFEREEEERLEAECKDRLLSLHSSLWEKREAEEKRMKEESAKEMEDLQETLKADRERQEREIKEENYALLEKVKTELKEEVAKTVQKLKARKKKGLDHLQAQLELELTTEKERSQTLKAKQQDSLMQESRESFTSVRQEVEQEQRRTLERLSKEHEKEIRKFREKHLKDKAVLKEQLLSRFNQEKEESAKELEELQEILKVDRERQALEIREENVAILEKVKTELKEELAQTLQELKARKKKRLDHLQAELEVELTSEKESFTSVRQEVEQEQRRTLERLIEDHEKEIRKLQEDKDLLKEQLLFRFNQEKEESAKELKELRDTLKEDQKRQEREIREENYALLEKVKTEFKGEVAKTVQKLKARKKKGLDHLQAQLELELTSEKERLQILKAKQQDSLTQESRVSFTSVRQEVEQEQRRTLERLSEDHKKEIRKFQEDRDLLKEQLLSRFNQEKEQREQCLALRLRELDFQHEAEALKRQRENSDKMLELKELPTELEVRGNHLEGQDAEVKANVERLSQRMRYLEEKDRRKKYEAEERNMKYFPSPTLKEEVEREHRYVTSGCRCDVSLDLLEKTNDELRTCRQDRENLVTMVDQLQRQCDRLSSRMNQFERTSLGSDVQCSSRFSEEPYHGGSPPLSRGTKLFLKLEADILEGENSRWRESQTPSSSFLSSWRKYRTEKDIADLNSRGYNY